MSSTSFPKLRIHRKWEWVQGPGEVRLGGPPNVQLKATDVLEADYGEGFSPVEIVSDPRPEHPADAMRREKRESAAPLNSFDPAGVLPPFMLGMPGISRDDIPRS